MKKKGAGLYTGCLQGITGSWEVLWFLSYSSGLDLLVPDSAELDQGPAANKNKET